MNERENIGLPPLEDAIVRTHWALVMARRAKADIVDAVSELEAAEKTLIGLRGQHMKGSDDGTD